MYDRKNPEAGNNLTMAKAINQALEMEMEEDSSIMVFGQDVGKNGGVFRVTEDLQDKFGKERVIDTAMLMPSTPMKMAMNMDTKTQTEATRRLRGIFLGSSMAMKRSRMWGMPK